MVIKDGGPAFPQTIEQRPDGPTISYYGLSVRDYFAAQALAGGALEFFQGKGGGAWADYNEFAESCYNMADAMLKEREK